MSATVIKFDYQGLSVQFNAEGWIYATEVAARFGREPNEWLRLPETIAYLEAMSKSGKIPELVKTRRGRNGGTWLHPKLAVAFARWLSADFAVWCDLQIDDLLHGRNSPSNSVMQALNEAISAMEADKVIASRCGMGLARWKRVRVEHKKAVEDASRRAQMLLGF